MMREQDKLWNGARGKQDDPFESAQLLYFWGRNLASRKAMQRLIKLQGTKKFARTIVAGCASEAYAYEEARTLFMNMFVMFLTRQKNKTFFASLFTLFQYLLRHVSINEYPSKKLIEDQCALLFKFALKHAKQEWITSEMQNFFSAYQYSLIFQAHDFFKKEHSFPEYEQYIDIHCNDISFDELWNYFFNKYVEKLPLRHSAAPFFCILVRKHPDEFILRLRSLYKQGAITRAELEALAIHFAHGETDYGFHIPKSFLEAFSRIYQQA